jgi:hypothetical protein
MLISPDLRSGFEFCRTNLKIIVLMLSGESCGAAPISWPLNLKFLTFLNILSETAIASSAKTT